MEKVHDFIGSLLDQKGITDIEPEAREQLISELTELLMQEIDNAAIRALPEEKAIELADGLENGSIKPEDVGTFLIDAGLYVEEISMITMLQFRDFYLGNAVPDVEANEPAVATN